MPSYALFGGSLDSDVPLHGLRLAGQTPPNWRLTVESGAPPATDGTLLGVSRVDEGVSVHLYRNAGGYRLDYDDTGTFQINQRGSEIVWFRPLGSNIEHARLDILGRVMAIALHAAGDFCAHASAVLTPQGAIGFLAPKFHGKSTLAMAMTHGGCPVLTDDTLPIGLGKEGVIARPGVPTLRLWSDSARRLAPDRVEGHVGGKYTMDHIPTFRTSETAFPLAALYLLAPQTAQSGAEVVSRDRLSAVQTALTLVAHAKTGELLGADEAPALLQRAVRIANHTPMYRLHLTRGYDRIAQAAECINTWHAARRQAAASA